MPLPAPAVPRRRIHTRRITLEGFLRDDGLYDLDASLTDTKDDDYPLASGLRPAGEPVHLLRIRVSFDAAFDIVDVAACSDAVPYPGQCDTIGPVYRKLIGLSLVRGFRRTVGEMFADVRGCTHLSELLLSLPTAAIQTAATFRRENEDGAEKPFQLDRCHALESSAEAVRLYYPKWYRPAGGGAPGGLISGGRRVCMRCAPVRVPKLVIIMGSCGRSAFARPACGSGRGVPIQHDGRRSRETAPAAEHMLRVVPSTCS